MRILTAIPESARAAYSHAFYHARWVDNIDLTDEKELEKILNSVQNPSWSSLQLPSIQEILADENIKTKLRENTDRAASRGVFGVPR